MASNTPTETPAEVTPPEPKWFGAAFRRYSTDNWSYGMFRSKQAAGQFATKSDGPDASGEVIPLYTQVELDTAVVEARRDFRSRLATAVRNCDTHVDDAVMELIETFPSEGTKS